MFRRWQIRVSHTQINNILSLSSGLHLQLIDNAEDIRGEPLHAMKPSPLGMKHLHIQFLSKEIS